MGFFLCCGKMMGFPFLLVIKAEYYIRCGCVKRESNNDVSNERADIFAYAA